MFRRLLFALLLVAATYNARALEYTTSITSPKSPDGDLPGPERDLPVHLVLHLRTGRQADWYTAELESDGAGTYSGPLCDHRHLLRRSLGPGQAHGDGGRHGVIHPEHVYHATLVYGLTGSPPVTKSNRRQTLIGYNMAGTYSGSASGTITGCANPADNESALRLRYTVTSRRSATIRCR